MKKLSVGISAVAIALMSAPMLQADDTEVYVSGGNVVVTERPQVLIILDDSGSMSTNETEVTNSYDPNTDYSGSRNSNRVYVGYSDKVPNGGVYINQNKNGCASSDTALQEYGKYTDGIMFYNSDNDEWDYPIDDGGIGDEWKTDKYKIDCKQDVIDLNAGASSTAAGSFPAGFPRNNDSDGYDDSVQTDSITEREAAAVTSLGDVAFERIDALYTGNYLNWHHDHRETTSQSRLRIAKDTISSLVTTTAGVDFGLAVFNANRQGLNDNYTTDDNGGRIIYGIQEMTETNRTNMLASLETISADGSTPLCETLFEAYRYFSGGEVKSPRTESPNADTDIVTTVNGKTVYVSPMKDCQSQAYIVLISDGSPQLDSHYNDLILAELGASTHENPITAADAMSSTHPLFDSPNNPSTNYLPAVAKFMYNNGINGGGAKQRVVTYTVGFSDGANDAAPLLSATATNGGGSYFPAKSANALSDALQQILTEILVTNASFTAPSVAASASDRTSTRDAVYYGMFLPSDSPRWSGNLKKLKINSNGEIVDAKGKRAIDASGNIDSAACTVWTDNATCTAADSGGDGNQVEVGGVVEQLLKQNIRNVKMVGSGGAIQSLTKTNLIQAKTNEAGLRSALGITADDNLDEYVNWLRGVDVDDDDGDGSTNETRSSVFGDPLHSKPLAISYAEGASADVRILVGTNQGYLHMFKDGGTSVSESWALFLPELLGNVKELRTNAQTGGHTVYGIDSSPVAYINDGNGNGEIDGGDTAMVYFGMRRGGSSYYAIDVTNPDNPILKWSINSSTTNFENLGQSWSEPMVTRINGNADPVVIFAGGYDTKKDVTTVGTTGDKGNSVYMVDALTGALVHRFEGTVTNATNTAFAAADSIPNKVAALDSDADGYTDRMYATDTGGNVWRIDMPGTDRTKWSTFKFASLGGDTLADDRRFFAEVSVAQTSFEHRYEIGTGSNKMVVANEVPYDAVVIGSGNRSHPNAIGTNDYLFALQDRHINTQVWGGSNPHPEAITVDNLYSIDGDPFGNISDVDDKNEKELEFGENLGWYYSLAATEKSLSAPLIVAGRAYFTTYTPGDFSQSNTCVAVGGANLYGFDLQFGKSLFSLNVGTNIPDSPQLLVPPMASDAGDDWSPSLSLVGVGPGQDGSGTLDTGQMLRPSRVYYHYGSE